MVKDLDPEKRPKFAPEPQPAPPDPKPAGDEMGAYSNFIILNDPGPDPLALDMELNLFDVYYGLKYKAFNPGTILLDLKERTTHTVRRRRQQLVLEPPSKRISLYIRSKQGPRARRAPGHGEFRSR